MGEQNRNTLKIHIQGFRASLQRQINWNKSEFQYSWRMNNQRQDLDQEKNVP